MTYVLVQVAVTLTCTHRDTSTCRHRRKHWPSHDTHSLPDTIYNAHTHVHTYRNMLIAVKFVVLKLMKWVMNNIQWLIFNLRYWNEVYNTKRWPLNRCGAEDEMDVDLPCRESPCTVGLPLGSPCIYSVSSSPLHEHGYAYQPAVERWRQKVVQQMIKLEDAQI